MIERRSDGVYIQVERKPSTYSVVKQEWIEYERGWGRRPDGYTLHKNEADRKAFVNDYNLRFNNQSSAPDCYAAANGPTSIVDVDELTYQKIAASKNGIWG